MLEQLDGSLSVSIAFDSWLGALPLANYQPIETSSLPSNYYHPTSGLMQILHFDWLLEDY